MAIPEWDDKFSIHNDEIDVQHKKLFDIAHRAGLLISKQVDGNEIKKILVELFEYMKVHFRDEEAYMASIGYPGLERQSAMHQQIIQDIKQKLAIITEEWLINHILKEDMQIEVYRKAHEEEIKALQAQQNGAKGVTHVYKCACKPAFKVLNTVHEKIQSGQAFHCKKCGEGIVFVRDE